MAGPSRGRLFCGSAQVTALRADLGGDLGDPRARLPRTVGPPVRVAGPPHPAAYRRPLVAGTAWPAPHGTGCFAVPPRSRPFGPTWAATWGTRVLGSRVPSVPQFGSPGHRTPPRTGDLRSPGTAWPAPHEAGCFAVPPRSRPFGPTWAATWGTRVL